LFACGADRDASRRGRSRCGLTSTPARQHYCPHAAAQHDAHRTAGNGQDCEPGHHDSHEGVTMETRRIGTLQVSVVGLGCNNFGWRLDAAQTSEVVHAALDAGINFFDTADIYGRTHSEELLGRALGRRRREVLIATKFGMAVDETRRGARPDYVLQAAEDSLRRLGTDRVDLYQIHQPDATIPIADTLEALEKLVTAGKVREIGCSNFSADQLQEAESAVSPGAPRFVSVQNEYSLLDREA